MTRLLDASEPTVHREVRRLLDADLLTRARPGRCGRIAAAFIYGSWAARWHGGLGPNPGDVELLVIGTPDRDEVNVNFASAERRASGEKTFLAAVRSRPLVPLHLPAATGEVA